MEIDLLRLNQTSPHYIFHSKSAFSLDLAWFVVSEQDKFLLYLPIKQ